MRLDRAKIINLGLVTLAEHVELAADGPIRPNPGLRLALAVIFAIGMTDDQGPFNEFWSVAVDGREGWSDGRDNSFRSTLLMTKLRGIMRAVGIEPCLATEQPLLDAARKNLPPRGRRFNPLVQRATEPERPGPGT